MKRRIACCLFALHVALGCAPVQRQHASPPNPTQGHSSAPTAAASAKTPARFSELPDHHAVEGPSSARQKSVPKDRAAEPANERLEVAPTPPPEQCLLPAATLPYGFYRDDAHTAGEVVLTFDDGPTVNHTPRVLKLLERHGYAATFFLVGKNVRSNTYHLVQRMLEQGHTIGSHSYNHDVEMSFRDNERSVGYIHGQHETTQILIELALLATSPEDFRAIYQRVFGIPEGRYLSGTELRTKWPEWEARHFELLRERGYPVLSREDDAARRYPVVYSRPPGGGPYLGSPKRLRKLNDAALERVGFLNVLWHDASGDTVEGVRNDSTALVGNLQRATRRGGVVLLHDYIRKDALETYLTELDKNDDWQVISLDSYSEAKYGCSPQAMRQALMAARPASD